MAEKLVSVNVTLGPAASKAAASTLAKLESAGLRDANFLEALGIVTGLVPEKKIGALMKVPGISVEKGETYQIAPPDAPIQ